MNNANQTETTEAGTPAQDDNTVRLETPIRRGNNNITQVTLRKPTAGELRGISLAELLQMKVDALQTV